MEDIERFVAAQDAVWDDVLSELRAGRKSSHWMWFVFPQLAALGRSGTARFYGLHGLEDARSYLDHPVLGPRLLQCCELLAAGGLGSPVDIFGAVDAMKLRSCLTLFAAAAPQQRVFRTCLEQLFGGEADDRTVEALKA